MVTVELVCKNEGVLVAKIQTSGALDPASIRGGMSAPDRDRVPSQRAISEGSQLFCRLCGGTLFFRTAKGDVPAAPSSYEVG